MTAQNSALKDDRQRFMEIEYKTVSNSLLLRWVAQIDE